MRILPLIALAGCGRIGFGAFGSGDAPTTTGDGLVADSAPLADVTVATLCPNAIPIGTGTTPSIAWTGSSYSVVYIDGLAVRFVPISAAAVPGTMRTLYTAPSAPANPTSTTLAWDGSEHVAIYAMDGLFGATFAADGTPITANTTLDSVTTAIQPQLQSAGTSTMRLDYTSTSSGYQQYTRGVIASPFSIDTTGTQLSNSAAGNGAYDPALAWVLTGWVAFWDDSRFQGGCYRHGIHFNTISTTGSVGGADKEIYLFGCDSALPTQRHYPAATWNGADVSLAWVGDSPTPAPVNVVRARADTGAATTSAQAASSRPATEVAVTWNGTDLALAWAGGGVFLTLTNEAGVPSAETAFDSAGQSVALVWDGTHYALVWERGGMIYFARTC